MIEAQRPSVVPAEKAAKPLPGAKGAAAEGGALRARPGQPEKIRLTVAYAERYGLIAKLPRSPAQAGALGRFGISAAAHRAAAFLFCGIFIRKRKHVERRRMDHDDLSHFHGRGYGAHHPHD